MFSRHGGSFATTPMDPSPYAYPRLPAWQATADRPCTKGDLWNP